jgi:hypothetical protein
MIRSLKILLGAVCAAALLSPALAETPAAPVTPAAPAAQAQPAISPAALELLKGMSETLAKSKSLSFNVKRAFEEPASTGQPLFYFVDSTVSLQRPDKLKVVVRGDGPPSEFLYDGKEFAVYLPASNLIAIESAPPNFEEMLEAAFDKAGIYFPFVDFIVSDPYTAITEKLTSAFVVGKSQVVGGVPTDIVAIANPSFHAQIWISAKDKLPRLAWISPVNGKGRALLEFSDWRLNSPLKFARSPAAAKAARIKFAKPGAPAAPAKP